MIFTRRTIPNAFWAAVRFVKVVLLSEPVIATDGVQSVREVRCLKCHHYSAPSDQCGLCTCVVALKTRMAAESCPDNPPRWRAQTKRSTGL